MKKVLIIEDRTQRQEQFLKKTGIKITEYDFIDNRIGEEYTYLKEALLHDVSVLDSYDVVISHRSAFDKDNGKILDLIKDYCEQKQKYLILFSGGISTSYYTKSPYESLSLNSKDFYSKNLELFLEKIRNEDTVNLLLLAFGKKWKLNLMLNVLEKLNNIDYDDIDDFDELDEETGIQTIDHFINLKEFEDIDEINIDLIEEVKKTILQKINHKLGIYYE